MNKATMILAVCVIFVVSAVGQDFLNLGFESAYNLPESPGYGVSAPVTNALPDWTVDGGAAYVNYASNSFFSTTAPIGLDGGSLALSGEFSVEFFDSALLSQTGSVPENAESLEFEAYNLSEVSGLSVTLGNQNLSYTLISQGPSYDVWGANIPADLDGQAEPLAFVCQGVGSGHIVLDNIEFSTMSVPEPGESAMIGVGAILIGGWRWRGTRARAVNG